MYSMLVNVGLVLAIVFVVMVSVWAWMVIAGSTQVDRESQRRQQLQDQQVARAREELIKRYE